MDKLLTVARREFLATIRTKAFILSVVLMPLLIVGSMFATQRVQEMGQQQAIPLRRLALVDPSGTLAEPLQEQIAQFNQERPRQPFELDLVPPAQANEAALRARVLSGELYGYLIIDPNTVTGIGEVAMARRDSQLDTGQKLERMLNDAVFNIRLRSEGLDPQMLALIRRPVPVREIDVKTGEAVKAGEMARVLTPFVFMFLLFMGTLTISMGLLTTVIEEKSSRVVELLLSALSPGQLMAGKILGTAAVGLVLMGVWAGFALQAANKYNVTQLVTSYRLTILLLYFLPGFLLLSSIQAGIGSACNELKEAQSMNFPISILTIVPMLFWWYVSEYPSAPLSIILSYIPPITPFMMVLRVCADPETPLWQIITTQALLWVSVGVAMWAAAKIFRIGILMYGKPPSLRELARWVRYS